MAQPVYEQFLQSPAGWVAIAGIGLVLGLLLMKKWLQRKERYDTTELPEVIRQPLYKNIDKNGANVGKRFMKGMVEVGAVRKAEVGDIDIGNWDGPQVSGEYHKLIVRPTGDPPSEIKNKFWWLLTRIRFLRPYFESVYLVADDNVAVDTDAVRVDSRAEFQVIGDVYVDNARMSMAAAEEQTFLEILKDHMTRGVNFIKYMNWLERRHSQVMQEMEWGHDLDMRGFGGGGGSGGEIEEQREE